MCEDPVGGGGVIGEKEALDDAVITSGQSQGAKGEPGHIMLAVMTQEPL